MSTYKRKINFKILFIVLFLSMVFLGNTRDLCVKAFLFKPPVETIVPLQSEEELLQRQANLANNVNLSEEIVSYASYNEDAVTIYNFVVSVRFSGESTRMDDLWDYSKTYYEAFDQMYNTGRYSVNEYYKNMTNGQVNLVSVLINDRIPASVAYLRSRYLEYSESNPNGYDTSNIIEEGFRRREILTVAFNSVKSFVDTSEYRDKTDFDNDGKIDSVSIIILPPNVSDNLPDPGWGHVLWPHQGAFPTIVGGISFKNSAGKTISSNKYMLDYMEIRARQSIDNTMQTPSATTAIHELGHLVFNMPDLYVYDETDLEYPDPVLWWDMMAHSHFQRAQYMTTYIREKAKWGDNQGFVKENQVIEIETNGDYTLQPVNYEEVNGLLFSFERVVAYKLVNPDNPNQSIYIEYRKQSKDYFDGSTSILTDGLLIYLVDEGFSNNRSTYPLGNAPGTPYNIFVYRGEINGGTGSYPLQLVPLNSQNQSVGEGLIYNVRGADYLSPNLFWQSYDTPATQGSAANLNYIDSGIVIKFKEENPQNQSMTFTVEWDRLPEPVSTVEREELDDTNLYNFLLDLAGKSIFETLEINDFVEFDFIGLSAKNISSLNGFEKFNFKNNVLIDLSNNNLSSLGSFESFYKYNQSTPKLNLAFNKFVSASKMQELGAYSSRAIFAMQKPDFSLIGYSAYNTWQLAEQDLIFHQNDFSSYYTLNTNYQTILNTGTNQLTSAGNFYFEFIANSELELNDYVIEIKVIEIDLLETLPAIEVFDTFLLENYLTLENAIWADINYQLLNENDTPIITAQLTSVIGTRQIKFVSNDLKIEVIFDLLVQDTEAPVVTLLSEDRIFMLKDSIMNTPLIEITDNYDQDLIWQTDFDLTNLANGENQIEIYALDSSGNKSNVVVVNIIILEIDIKNNLEISLNEVFDYSNSYTFLPIEYHNQFDMVVEIEIDNALVAMQTFVLSFTNKQNIEQQLVINGQVLVKDMVAPTIELVSESEIFVFKGETFKFPEVIITDNYDQELSAQNIQTVSTLNVGVQNLDLYAEDSSGNCSNIIRVYVIVLDATIEYGMVINLNDEIDYESLVEILPQNYAPELEIEVVSFADTSIIGNRAFSIKVYHKEQTDVSKTINSIVQVRDIEPPTIKFDDDIEVMYLYMGESFAEPKLTVEDNYDLKSSIIISRSGVVKVYEAGTYYLTYKAIDTSGNFSEIRLKVIVVARPIDNLAIIKVSNIKVITPNTSITFRVDTNNPALEGKIGTINFAWFVNGERVKVTKQEYFEYSFKTMGTYEIEVKEEKTDPDGNKVYSTNAQVLTIVVDEGGILDKYSLIVIVIIASSIIVALIVTTVIRKRRKMFF